MRAAMPSVDMGPQSTCVSINRNPEIGTLFLYPSMSTLSEIYSKYAERKRPHFARVFLVWETSFHSALWVLPPLWGRTQDSMCKAASGGSTTKRAGHQCQVWLTRGRSLPIYERVECLLNERVPLRLSLKSCNLPAPQRRQETASQETGH